MCEYAELRIPAADSWPLILSLGVGSKILQLQILVYCAVTNDDILFTYLHLHDVTLYYKHLFRHCFSLVAKASVNMCIFEKNRKLHGISLNEQFFFAIDMIVFCLWFSRFPCPQCTRLVRERRRVARILLLLAVLFAFCWLPYNVLALLFDLGVNKNIKLFSFALLLGHANSAINPILYCFMTRNFRRAVRDLVLCSRVSLATRQHQRCNVSTAKGRISASIRPNSINPTTLLHKAIFQIPPRPATIGSYVSYRGQRQEKCPYNLSFTQWDTNCYCIHYFIKYKNLFQRF
jgi:hypothetical protein